MADETTNTETDGEETSKDDPIEFDSVVDIIQTYFEVTLPDDVVDEATLRTYLAGLVTTPGEEAVTEEEGTVTPTESSMETPMYMGPKRAKAQSRIEAENASLRKRLALVEQSKRDAERKAFHEAVDELAAENRITPGDAKQYKADADQAKSYRLSLLSPLKKLPQTAVPTGGVAKRLGAGAEEGGKDPGPMTPSRAKEVLKAFRERTRY